MLPEHQSSCFEQHLCRQLEWGHGLLTRVLGALLPDVIVKVFSPLPWERKSKNYF